MSQRCINCGSKRKGGHSRLSAPALLTLAAEEVAEGVDMDSESIEQLVLLRKSLRAAGEEVDRRIEALAKEMAERPYQEAKVLSLRRRLKL